MTASRSGRRGWVPLLAMLLVLQGCDGLFKPDPTALSLALEALPRSGVALVVDGCVQRNTAIGTHDYYGIEESDVLAARVQAEVQRSLDAHRVKLVTFAQPFTCGIRAADEDRKAYLAPKFYGADPVKVTLPAARFPTTDPATPRGKALVALLALAAVEGATFRPESRQKPVAAEDLQQLRALLKTRYVLVVSGSGRYTSTGVVVQNVIAALTIGNGVFDHTQLEAALIDLDDGTGVWGSRPRDEPSGNGIDPTHDFAKRAKRDIDALLEPMWAGTPSAAKLRPDY